MNRSVSPKKPKYLIEVVKQKELSGSQELIIYIHVRKWCSLAKSKEHSGNDIYSPLLELPPRSINYNLDLKEEPKEIKESIKLAPLNVCTFVIVSNPTWVYSKIIFGQDTIRKTLKRIYDQKVVELSTNNIFKGDTPVNFAEKPVSVAKLREMSGSDIFADEKLISRDCLRGIKKLPRGESSIALV